MNALTYKVCPECGNKMLLKSVTRTFRFHEKEIEIKGIDACVCEECGEVVYTATEAKMIDRIIHAISETQEQVQTLNLSETAQFLRVSNQTVYNMIREGRIKAYKAGREWRFLRGDILAYMDSTSNQDMFGIAAKGGEIDPQDALIISKEIRKRSNK